jgi:hypothetical protein
MSDLTRYVLIGAIVFIAILVLVAFARGWLAKFSFRHGDTEIRASAPLEKVPTTDVLKSNVKESRIRTRSGGTRINKSKIKNTDIKNG